MKKYLKITSVLASTLLLVFMALSSCSKDDGPAKKEEIEEEAKPLVLTLSSASIMEGEVVEFSVNANNEAVTNATIYIDGTAITGYEHTFYEPGNFKAVAKKEGYLDSQEVNIEVSEEWVDVYVAGYEILNGSEIATYWKNGEPRYLTDGTSHAQSYAIAVHNWDVYVLVKDGNAIKYWKNDQENMVYEGVDGQPVPRDMSISSNGDVFIVGSVPENGGYVAKYWKNGGSGSLTYNTDNTFANGVAINNDDLYVAGYASSGIGIDIPTALYWKNGVAVPLSDGNLPAHARKIAVSGDDVHVVGEGRDAAGKSSPKYWKNGTEIPLPNGTDAVDIAIVGDDVYIVGGYWGVWYWKNGTHVSLEDAATATGVAVYNKSVYTSGQVENKANATFVAAYWKDTTLFLLADETHDSNANSIAVVIASK